MNSNDSVVVLWTDDYSRLLAKTSQHSMEFDQEYLEWSKRIFPMVHKKRKTAGSRSERTLALGVCENLKPYLRLHAPGFVEQEEAKRQ